MHNKEKLHKKYLIQARFLINKVLHEIFKKNRNIIKKIVRIPKLITSPIQGQNDMKRIWKKIIQIANVNKRFTAFTTMIKHENHTIDNISKISENCNDFLWSLVKSLKIKFLHPMRRSMRMLSFKMRNLKEMQNDILNQQSWGFFQSSAFRSSHLEVLYKRVVPNNFEKFSGKHGGGVLF